MPGMGQCIHLEVGMGSRIKFKKASSFGLQRTKARLVNDEAEVRW